MCRFSATAFPLNVTCMCNISVTILKGFSSERASLHAGQFGARHFWHEAKRHSRAAVKQTSCLCTCINISYTITLSPLLFSSHIPFLFMWFLFHIELTFTGQRNSKLQFFMYKFIYTPYMKVELKSFA